MNMFKKINNMFASEEDVIVEENEQINRVSKNTEKEKSLKVSQAKKSVNIGGLVAKKGDVVLCEPLVFADSKDIIDDIKANRVVILNLHKLDLKNCDRLLDFVSGGLYALDAKLKSIGDEIYLCVPKDVDVAGEFSEGEY